MSTLHFLRNAEQGKRFRPAYWFFGRLAVLLAMSCLVSGTGLAIESFCTKTARAAFHACQHEVTDDFWIAIGNCNNLSDPNARAQCTQQAKVARTEGRDECGEQRQARLEICQALGEAPYDPQIDPANFVDPTQIGKTIAPNPYFPLLPGRTWIYKGGSETITVTVTGQTREILGVTCAEIHDVVKDNGEVIEDTKDWFAQDMQGNVWYFGEISQTLEDGQLVSLEGSWTAGVDGAKVGLIMKAHPAVGDVYRQEFSLVMRKTWRKC